MSVRFLSGDNVILIFNVRVGKEKKSKIEESRKWEQKEEGK